MSGKRQKAASLADEKLDGSRSEFVTAIERRDLHAVAAVYAEQARLLAPSAEVFTGRHAIERFWAAGIEAGLQTVVLEPLELERRDGRVYEIGRYAMRLEPAGGDQVVEGGKYLLVHERQADGSWRWAVEMFNPDSPPSSGATPKEETT
jgi:ketosteroid isomerase-like protein